MADRAVDSEETGYDQRKLPVRRRKLRYRKTAGPFELCHCPRCRKVSGSAVMAGLYVKDEDFRFLAGKERLTKYQAPIMRGPPAYEVWF
jgi:hypothetical protein